MTFNFYEYSRIFSCSVGGMDDETVCLDPNDETYYPDCEEIEEFEQNEEEILKFIKYVLWVLILRKCFSKQIKSCRPQKVLKD